MVRSKKLTNRVFFQFAVALQERCDLEALKAYLAQQPESHREELIQGARKSGDGYTYSALQYMAWLCDPAIGQGSQEVVRWLIESGAPADLWVHIGLREEELFVAALDAEPTSVNALHPIWGSRLLEHVPADWRKHLLERGVDVSDIHAALILGDLERAREMVQADAAHLTDTNALNNALIQGHDDFACWMIDQGAPVDKVNRDGYGPVLMACSWGCPLSLQKMIDDGASTDVRVGKASLVGLAVNAPKPNVEVLRILLESGLSVAAVTQEGVPVLEECRGKKLHEHARLLNEWRVKG